MPNLTTCASKQDVLELELEFYVISFHYPFRNGFVSDFYWFGFCTKLGIVGHCVYGAKLEAATQTFRDHFISRRSTAPIIECQL